MKLILSLTLIWALSSTAGALVCQTCSNLLCSSTVAVTCTSATMCVTASSLVNVSGTTEQQIIKACASSSLCPAAGSQTFSETTGFSSAVISALCCSTNNCNSDTLPFPAVQSYNSLQCFSCDSLFATECTTPIQCRGVEDRCYQTNVTVGSTSTSVSGCASRNGCAAAANLGNLLSMQSNVDIKTETTCCTTSLCNSVTSVTASSGMIHLLLGLLVFTFY
ncbi:phospholipase A2 inhibitor and Ly6/PLAUR domain-containing protein-like isoform X1 [Seriola aureovittata]|uniref:phospholipase A2 inhibitor and Ly6/PLAUR domain-containing protein-like isoform X1 n=1 Tax=Seriola aureovittata TaxID=2871759 RepID=UPI0024BF0D5B|nr:phospholipase A2 inhibitor and Ly6/PLAUR domain-containing protein-like isoform X1 [Seriola aureovittata]